MAFEIVWEKFLRRFLALAFLNNVFGIFSSLNHMATVVSPAFCQSNIMQTAAAIVVDYPPRQPPVESQSQTIPLVLDAQVVDDPNDLLQVDVTIHSDG